MKLLDPQQIKQKIKRLAIEILEENFSEDEIILAGINNNGYRFAQLIENELLKKTTIPISISRIRLNPANPTETEVLLNPESVSLTNKVVILIDDVANTGRTIFYAFIPLLKDTPKKVQVAVLVDRKHKAFPVKVDFMGLSLATTLQENIDVKIISESELAVYLN